VFADAAYLGKLGEWMEAMFDWTLEIVHKGKDKVFHVLPKRWIIERSLSWLGNYRRLSKDYEVSPASSEAMVNIAFSRILLKQATR
jgi:putative transposase